MAFTATRNLPLAATTTGSWPRPAWYSESLWGRPLDSAMLDPIYREQFSDALAIVVSDQERAGLDLVTCGDYFLDADLAGRSWHHYPLQRWRGGALAVTNGIVRVSLEWDVRISSRHPHVERVVQEQIRQQWTYHPTLRRSRRPRHDAAVLHLYGRLQPAFPWSRLALMLASPGIS